MKRLWYALVLGALVAWGAAGCDESNPGGGGLAALLGAKGNQENQFTILLMTLEGEGHVALAKHFETRTKEYTGWKGVFVVHKDKHSLLFWGRYPSIDKAEPYLKKAKAFRSKDTGLKPFAQAMTVPLPGRQVGPAKWSVLNVPANYYYTVLVADFFNVPDQRYLTRKEDTVSYCKELRDQGYEAYYHHGPSHSGVMIGKFDNSVIRMVQKPGKPVRKQVVGREVHALQKRFPFLAVNGRKLIKRVTDPKTRKTAEAAEKCRLITIPGRKARPPRVVQEPDTPVVPDRPRIFP